MNVETYIPADSCATQDTRTSNSYRNRTEKNEWCATEDFKMSIRSSNFHAKVSLPPNKSLTQMVAFEDTDEDNYFEIIKYFTYIGGFTLKEVISIALRKESQIH
ncbi:uncharacterized protein LOC105434265 isoform X2 [Pogonomyrmex barbatus]|uniref:Uncharacterized protein LOC105434265 isoform X2 n=1 Tax=Pogonomyrmex barbatus TaxID=144034 RepID=A0A8N1SAR4_9HYME|nr:uncharacterized protein LOC105434265 isoform X2 [Pogonomyrmex barbatus]